MTELWTLFARVIGRYGRAGRFQPAEGSERYTGRHRATAVEARRELSGTPYVPMDDLLSTE